MNQTRSSRALMIQRTESAASFARAGVGATVGVEVGVATDISR
jgi:hypothetical protein